MDAEKDFFTIYFAGELFTHKDLIGNAMLAEEIFARSGGKFRCALPQNFEQRKDDPKSIRDEDILNLLECDLAIFNYDGQELDSGTVVEFMFAKFADIPALLLRSDFRSGGDCCDSAESCPPWNLMTSFYPRTKTLLLNSAQLYKESVMEYYAGEESTYTSASSGSQWGRIMLGKIATRIVESLEGLLKIPPTMNRDCARGVYDWLSKMPDFSAPLAAERIAGALKRKSGKNMI